MFYLKNSNKMSDIYINIQEYNPDKKERRTFLIVFDDIIADILNKKRLNSIVIELGIRGRKSNISLVFILQSCFAVPKIIRLNSADCFIIKIPNKREFQ